MPVKTTIVVDEKLWAEFQRAVVARYGSARRTSEAVEELLRAASGPVVVSELAKVLNLKVEGFPSAREVKARRVKSRLSAGELLRAMRDERAQRLSRLK